MSAVERRGRGFRFYLPDLPALRKEQAQMLPLLLGEGHGGSWELATLWPPLQPSL